MEFTLKTGDTVKIEPGADLAGADLSWADLAEANLVGANLYKADLRLIFNT